MCQFYPPISTDTLGGLFLETRTGDSQQLANKRIYNHILGDLSFPREKFINFDHFSWVNLYFVCHFHPGIAAVRKNTPQKLWNGVDISSWMASLYQMDSEVQKMSVSQSVTLYDSRDAIKVAHLKKFWVLSCVSTFVNGFVGALRLR